MDSKLLGSSLSSRSHAPSEQSIGAPPSITPRVSFRYRRRHKEHYQRIDQQSQSPPQQQQQQQNQQQNQQNQQNQLNLLSQEPISSPPQTFKPWQRIRTRLSVMDDLAHLPAAAAACVSSQNHDDTDPTKTSGEFTPTITSINTSPTSSSTKNDHPARARRLNTNTSTKRRPIRSLVAPPTSNLLEKNCASITEFLRSVCLPAGCAPESVDTAFKAHTNLLRKLTIHNFDLNRYLFAYKPLARVNAVLATTFLNIADIDQKNFPMTLPLRSAAMYLAGNAHRSVYVMTYSAQLKSISRSRPAAEGMLSPMILEGQTLNDTEIAALDFVQEVSSSAAAVSEGTRRKVLDGNAESDGRLERLVTGTAAYGAFLSTLTSTVDIELTHGSIQYAANNLFGLPWKRSGAPVNVGFQDDDIGDFGSGQGLSSGLGSKHRPKRERLSLTRNYDRHSRNGRSKARGIRRVSQFFTSSLMGPKTITDVNRITETWMKAAGIPPAGQLFDINDEICSLFGFHPFYLSTAAVDGELPRRAFLFGAKELLFKEKEISKRLKFIICYVLSSGKERQRILESDHSRNFERQGVHNGHSITSVYTHRTYDSLSIMSAHAAFLACKYGAYPAELVAATDASRVRSAMERYCEEDESGINTRSIGFPLTKRDCAAVLIAHSLMQESPCIENRDLKTFESTFGIPAKNADHSSRPSRRALLEILGAASMWSALERFATGALAFDIDLSSNMVFGTGRAEPTISEFCRSAEGRKIGLSLASNEGRDVTRVRSDSRASRTSSLRPSMKGSRRIYRKRTSSALSSNSRMGRLFGSTSSDLKPEQHATAAT